MDNWYFHFLDFAHGAVMATFVYFTFRLLIFRKEGALRLRYLAAGLLVLAVLQILNFFDDSQTTPHAHVYEVVTLTIDACTMFLSILIIWIFYRNRYIFPKNVTRNGTIIMITIILCYIFCALWRFEEWTYPIYLIVSTVGWVLFCLAIERIPEKHEKTEQKAQPVDQYSDFRKQLDDVMHNDKLFCNEELTRKDVCRAMCTNRTTFSIKLKEAYNKTFSEYLRDMRLQEAARLLRETDMPIDQVAFSVGLKSASGFYRNFLLSYGMTPTQYRQKHK